MIFKIFKLYRNVLFLKLIDNNIIIVNKLILYKVILILYYVF